MIGISLESDKRKLREEKPNQIIEIKRASHLIIKPKPVNAKPPKKEWNTEELKMKKPRMLESPIIVKTGLFISAHSKKIFLKSIFREKVWINSSKILNMGNAIRNAMNKIEVIQPPPQFQTKSRFAKMARSM